MAYCKVTAEPEVESGNAVRPRVCCSQMSQRLNARGQLSVGLASILKQEVLRRHCDSVYGYAT